MLLFTKEQLRDDVILCKAKQKEMRIGPNRPALTLVVNNSEIQLHKYSK